METLSGVVERITFCNEENGFTVIKVKSKGFSELVTVVGNLAAVNVGATVKVRGEWKVDSKYGRQFNAVEYYETVPATVAGIEKYLGSGLIKGIGPVYSKKIVRKFKEDTIRIIEEEPDRLSEVEGIGPKRLEMIKNAWQEQKEIKNVMLFLQGNGVSTAYAVKIYKAYGNESISVVKSNPYKLADDIWGIGFKTADKIARHLGYDKNSFERCRSGILYVLNELVNEGHCYAGKTQLIEEAGKMLEIDRDLIDSTICRMIDQGAVIADVGDSIYLPPFYYSEVGVARRIKEILSVKSFYNSFSLDRVLEQVQRECRVKYDDVQLEAIKTAAKSKFMVLTGGPGTGKTTTTLGIIRVFQKISAKVLLAAPTGRAAKRLSETTGMEAKTIHRLLEYKPPDGYKKNEDNPLDCDVVIIDETSMVDIILMYNLLKAVPDHAIVILVGDADQLPSVGAGNILKDTIESGIVSVIRLTRIFRQALDSTIITNAHKINNGQFPALKGRKKDDFFFIEEEEPEKIVEIIKGLCTSRLPSYYKVDPVRDIQVLSPMQRGEIGTSNLNLALQEALNPSDVCIKYGGTIYKLKDKVMQVKNNYEKNVFNGDIGIITRIDQEDKVVTISFDENEVEYDVTELDEVVLAYATTIHKSQGSEFDIVVAPIATQHYIMLKRNLLYTCVTRAKRAIVLVGTKKAIAIAVSNNKTQKRNTMLAERLRV
ncbi:MAG: ATP-dependent RecD-like DNA helicase [Clostridiaceae bacterium]|nr:ATP-dependent RecD-like DNA helicase [Clostridiaceae bacterium]